MVLVFPENPVNSGHSKLWEDADNGGCRTECSKEKRGAEEGSVLLVFESLGMAVQEQESITYTSPMHDGHEILLKGVQDVCCRAEN